MESREEILANFQACSGIEVQLQLYLKVEYNYLQLMYLKL